MKGTLTLKVTRVLEQAAWLSSPGPGHSPEPDQTAHP